MTAIATAIGPVGPEIWERVPAEDGGEEPDRDRPVDPGDRPQARGHAEGQTYGQPHHGCGNATEDVSPE